MDMINQLIMNVNSSMVLILTIVTREMANEKLGVVTEPSPEILQWRRFTFVQLGLKF